MSAKYRATSFQRALLDKATIVWYILRLMKQFFKSIYFKDHPAESSAQRHVRLAFGANERSLYERVQAFTSEELRRLLVKESFDELAAYAKSNALSINRACISLLHRSLGGTPLSDVASIPALESDPLIATYRSGNGEPLHDWFPLLEGYSPRFVRAVLQTYAPEAQRVLDPFGGTGSTPLTVASMGLTGFFCELNPVFQFVIDTKYRVIKLPARPRKELAQDLDEIAFSLNFQLGNLKPDGQLRATYRSAFGGSAFFDDATFEDVLRLRTLGDDLFARKPLLGQVFVVSVLASLVSASLMIRRGDLRYRRSEELESRLSIRAEVCRRLQAMALAVAQLEQVSGEAILVAENAQSLAKLPGLEVECVVTSPPYLNGTNYFRNTKLELWFLRVLASQEDLAAWRSRALTAGINDVTQAKCGGPYPDDVRGIVEQVQAAAYDGRIPLMISSYFGELDQFLQTLSYHLKPGAVVAIDIGDSRYGGVHVETDKLLAKLASKRGFQAVDSRVLRVRKSRDGGLLRQTLLTFKYQASQYVVLVSLGQTCADGWEEFKSGLPHQSPPFNKRNWGHPLHSLCSYEGKMKPSIAHFLTKTFVPDGGRVLDPFAGVGTIPFEACLQGKQAYGFEISPPAFSISTAKVNRPDDDSIWKLVDSLETYVKAGGVTDGEVSLARQIDFNRDLTEFYHRRTLEEILLARRFFLALTTRSTEASFVLASLLHILHGNRPYALSRHSHPVTPFAPVGPTEYRPMVERLRTKVQRSLAVEYPNAFQNGHIYMQDATSWWPAEVQDLDAIITSPPFFDSTRFYLANWIRLWFSGWERNDFETEPLRFVDTRQKHSMRVYESVFRQARERMKASSVVVLHLGKSAKCDMAQHLSEVAKPWFKTLDVFEESVSHCESHGITDKGTVSVHQYLVLG